MTVKGTSPQMRTRLSWLTLLILAVGFGMVAIRLLYMQVFHYDFYVQKATTLQTRDAIVTPNRGKIYDTNMQVLAESASVKRITVSPGGVVNSQLKESGVSEEEQQQKLARLLADNLGLDYETVLKKVQRTDTTYQIIAEKVDQETSEKLMKVLETEKCTGVYPEPDTKRYYQYGSYLSAVLGYVRSDNLGVYGLESQYESELAGTAGRIVRSQNAQNQDMPYEYEQELPATDGNSLVLTIDSDIQSYLEKHLETALADNPEARRGVSGIVMNVKTGAVLAMASLPDFDPNEPYVISNERYLTELKTNVKAALTEMGLTVEIPEKYYREGGKENLPENVQNNEELIDQLTAIRSAVLYKMWYNPVITDTYEPGSTFKLMNVATAFELGVAHESDSYFCAGSMMVGDWEKPIKCWKTEGHGPLTLEETLINSCNCGMMQIAAKIKMERFYDFMKAFGLRTKTGIDLPNESNGIFHDVDDPSQWNEVSLATASFGQRFTVTPLQMITMVSAIVDDGKLKKPYVVREVLNADGSVKSTVNPTVVRQVISSDTSAFMRKAMESVVDGGTGKNAYVAGYRVGGKTATSEIQPLRDKDGKVLDTEDRYTASFIGVAPMDDPQIAVLVAIQDLPESATHGGGAIAAPVVGRVIEDVLPYLGATPGYSENESDRRETAVPNVIGKSVEDAMAAMETAGFAVQTEGDGKTVTDQVPAGGIKIPSSGQVILYLGGSKPSDQIEVPPLIGLTPEACREKLAEANLYLKQKGVASSQVTEDTTASRQNPVAGTKVNIGAVVTVEFANSTDVDDR